MIFHCDVFVQQLVVEFNSIFVVLDINIWVCED